MQEQHDNSAMGGRRRSLLLAASLILIAFNLRTAITSVGPVLVDAIHSLNLTGAEASILTTIPSLCFGLFGPLAPALSRRLGRERALLAVLVLQVAGMALRGLHFAPALFLGQTLAAIGIGVTNVLLPGLVKRDFPRRIPAMTGLYTMSFCLGAAIAAGATVPLEHLSGSWSLALAFWTLPAALAILCWLPWIPRRGQSEAARPTHVHRLWRDPLAWQVTFFMGLQSALAYIVFGWLAPILRDRGLSAIDAGFALSLCVITQAGASLVAPTLASLGRDQRMANLVAVIVSMIGFLGCIYAPLSTVWVWSFLLGLGQGSTIAIALMLIALRATDPHIATRLSGMVQGIGYLIASCGPLLAGLLHSWSGGWNLVALLSIAIGIGLAVSGLGAGRAGHVGVKATSP